MATIGSLLYINMNEWMSAIYYGNPMWSIDTLNFHELLWIGKKFRWINQNRLAKLDVLPYTLSYWVC